MNKNVLIKGPLLSTSGYGEQARFALQSMLDKNNVNVYLRNQGWGNSSWIAEDSEKRTFIWNKMKQTQYYESQGGNYDVCIHVTIPEEVENLADINILYTAAVETDRISPEWIQRINNTCDGVITISQHSENVLKHTAYKVGKNNQQLKVNKPVYKVNYPFRACDKKVDLELDLKHDFNFLTVANWAPRKNIAQTIRGFLEEFKDDEVGLVMKLNSYNNSLIDRRATRKRIKQVLTEFPEERKCSLHFLHGDMTEQEMLSLYRQEKIRAYVTSTHGEGFGLPIFEAACAGIPVIAPDFSGHLDFLRVNDEDYFTAVDYQLKEIQDHAQMGRVLIPDSRWAFVKKQPFLNSMRDVKDNYPDKFRRAKKLRRILKKNFKAKNKAKKFQKHVKSICNKRIEQHLLDTKEDSKESVDKYSFCMLTNAEEPEKTRKSLKSIHNAVPDGQEYEIVLAGICEPFEDLCDVTVDRTHAVENGRTSEARNAAAEASQGDAIVFVDDDVIFDPDWVKDVNKYTEEEGWNVLTSKFMIPEGGRFWDRAMVKPHVLVDYDHPPNDNRLYITGGLLAVRRDVFERHKWDENRGFYEQEDTEYSRRLLIKDKNNLKICEDALAWHFDDEYTQHNNYVVKKEELDNTDAGYNHSGYLPKFEKTIECLEE